VFFYFWPMSILLHIETATKNCSVALSKDGQCLAIQEASGEQFSHSEKLHLFIESLLKKQGIKPQDLAAVVVDKGPGSYTGLRIGVATAKGLCYALQLPLVALNSLEILVAAYTPKDDAYIIPMLDARRNEVYTGVFDAQKQLVKPLWAEELQQDSYAQFTQSQATIVLGNAQEKAQQLLPQTDFEYPSTQIEPSAKDMILLGTQRFENGDFEDLAYFEPFYLKEFYTTPPKK